MRKYKVHVYMLYLLQFADGSVVFTSEESTKMKKMFHEAISAYGGHPIHAEAEFDTHALNKDVVVSRISTQNIKIVEADIGYYHHRVISDFKLEITHADINGQIRECRDVLRAFSNTIVSEYEGKINSLPKSELRADGRILGFYEYQLIIVEKSPHIYRKLQIPFSFQTTSLCFDIMKPTYWGPKKMLVRISIPCTIVYGNIRVNRDKALVRDLINAIYQYALYGRKKRLVEMGAGVRKEIKDPYKIDEQDLQDLWAYMIDTMGGKTSNVHSFIVMRATLSITFMAFIVSILMIVMAIVSKGSPVKETAENINKPVGKAQETLSAPVHLEE